ncbi:hypothetical protein V3C99_000224 [Haemonchus contortus]
MDVDMAEASGVRNAELEELKRQLEEKQREIDQFRAEQAAVKKGLSATDEAIPEWARVAAGIESLDAGQLQAVFKEDIGVERLEDEYEVADAMHFRHVESRCDGPQFPPLDRRAGFPLETCRGSRDGPRGNPSVVDRTQSSGEPAIKDRRISNRHLKRAGKRKLRSLPREAG